MDDKDPRGAEQEARDFASRHLERLSRELLEWQKTGRLPERGVFPELAALVARYLGEDDAFQQAERLVQRLGLERVAGGLAPAGQGHIDCEQRVLEELASHMAKSGYPDEASGVRSWARSRAVVSGRTRGH